jgi:hypothetical protein
VVPYDVLDALILAVAKPLGQHGTVTATCGVMGDIKRSNYTHRSITHVRIVVRFATAMGRIACGAVAVLSPLRCKCVDLIAERREAFRHAPCLGRARVFESD